MKQNKQDEQWLDEIRQALADHEEQLPADGWEKIAAALVSESDKEVLPKNDSEQPYIKRIIPLWLSRSTAAIAILVVVLGGVYFFSKTPTIDDPVLTDNRLVPNDPIADPFIGADTVIESSIVPPATPHAAHSLSSVRKSVDMSVPNELPQAQQEIATIVSNQESADTLLSEPSSALLPDMLTEEHNVLLAMDTHRNTQTRDERHWKAGFRLSGSLLESFRDEGTDSFSNAFMPDPDSTSTHLLTRAKNLNEEILDSENHLSWSVGLSVSRQLSSRLALETGLTYTYLSSDVILSRSGRQHQQLHYLGIPLKLNALISEVIHWQFYSSVGTMLEHSLWGKRGSTDLHLNDWQWSVNAGLGLQYKLNRTMGLYIEPCLYHYFDNSSDISSFRTESPFSFNLQVGIRFGL